MKKVLFLVFTAFVFSACIPGKKVDSDVGLVPVDNSADAEVSVMMDKTESSKDVMIKEISLFTLSGELADVSGGSSTGTAMAGFTDGTYNLYATFNNLPTPGENFFYEGWAVRKSPFAFISTGELNNKDSVYSNTYMSGADYSDYDFYVLTIEPTDDGVDGKPDPAPAEHILEGTMTAIVDSIEKTDKIVK